MKIIKDPKAFQNEMIQIKRTGKSIGFVPTMGSLHTGHLSLVEMSKQQTDITVVSIFVNPMQFGPNEDFNTYPRTLQSDLEKLEPLKIDYLFTPTTDTIYPLGKDVHTSVEINRLTNKLCSKSRPVFFKGITSVVSILFNIVQPDIAVFGKKDYQQYKIIQSMVKDLMFPIKIIGGETVREKNGLAMSSRNNYLSEQQREQASLLRKVLLETAEQLKLKTKSISQIKSQAKERITHAKFKMDYFDIIRQSDLEDATLEDTELLIAVGVWLNDIRLIDNLELELN